MRRDSRLHLDSGKRLTWATRTLLVAMTGVLTGAVAHGVMGGHRPSLLSLVPALVFSALLSLGLTKHARPLRLGLAAGVSQGVFHALFVLEAGPSPMAHSSVAHGLPDPTELGLPLTTGGADTWMTLGHAVAAVVSASSVSVLAATLRLFGELREVLHSVSQLVDLSPVLASSGRPHVTAVWGTSKQQERRSSQSTRAPPTLLG